MDFANLIYVDEENSPDEDINALLNETIRTEIITADDDTPAENTEADDSATGLDAPSTQPLMAHEPDTKKSRKTKDDSSTSLKKNIKLANSILRTPKDRAYGGHFQTDPDLVKKFDIHDFLPDFPQAELVPLTYNVICIAKVPIEGQLDLKTLYARCKCVEFGSENRPVLHMTITEPRAMTAFIYQNATIRLVGAPSIMAAKVALRRVMQIIKEVFRLKFTDFQFTCCNLMSNFDYLTPVRIAEFAQKYPNACFYEPLIFSGVVVGFDNGVRALVYVSGKCTMIGARSLNELLLAFQTLTRRIAPYFKEGTGGVDCSKDGVS